jgi:hypothetical protein
VLLVELDAPGVPTGATRARIETGGAASSWFAWARVAAGDLTPIARAGGFTVSEVWCTAGRWFARCVRDDRRVDQRRGGGPSSPTGPCSVP